MHVLCLFCCIVHKSCILTGVSTAHNSNIRGSNEYLHCDPKLSLTEEDFNHIDVRREQYFCASLSGV